MATVDRHQMHFGPYQTPWFNYGASVKCIVHGYVTITRISDGRIPWPMCTQRGGYSLVLFEDLCRAVECEAACAVGYWFGVSTWMVRKWRRVLNVAPYNEGDRLLKSAYAKGHNGELARQAALVLADDPVRRSKISAAQRGRARPPEVI